MDGATDEYLKELLLHVPTQQYQAPVGQLRVEGPRSTPGPIIGAYVVSAVAGALVVVLAAVLYGRRD
jgi:hypothetical protein